MTAPHPMLATRDVTVERGGVPVVRDLTLDVGAGEVVALLGPSGAGKSSLLLAIAGLLPVASGQVWAGRVDVTAHPSHLRRVGMMFQEYALFPHMSVLENVRYGLRGPGRGEIARQWLDRVGLPAGTFADRDVATLSGGQRQRVALARALAPEPAVLLLDEPLGSLDRQLREELLGELVEVVRAVDGPAVIAVTHDRDEAFTLGDRVGVLREGRLVALDTPAQLWSAPGSSWVARFLGHDTVLEPGQAAALGVAVATPVAVPASAVRLSSADAAGLGAPGSGALGQVVRAAWRDGRRRVTVEVAGIGLVAEVPAGELAGGEVVRVGDQVRVRIDPAGLVHIAEEARRR